MYPIANMARQANCSHSPCRYDVVFELQLKDGEIHHATLV